MGKWDQNVSQGHWLGGCGVDSPGSGQGLEVGFVNTVMNLQVLSPWSLLNIQTAVIMKDNSSYHSVSVDKTLALKSKESDIVLWLLGKNTPYDPNQARAELLGSVQLTELKVAQYKLDALTDTHGHTVVTASILLPI
jgi:hypothetical protein